MTTRQTSLDLELELRRSNATTIALPRETVVRFLRIVRAAEQWNEDPLSPRRNAALRVEVEG